MIRQTANLPPALGAHCLLLAVCLVAGCSAIEIKSASVDLAAFNDAQALAVRVCQLQTNMAVMIHFDNRTIAIQCVMYSPTRHSQVNLSRLDGNLLTVQHAKEVDLRSDLPLVYLSGGRISLDGVPVSITDFSRVLQFKLERTHRPQDLVINLNPETPRQELLLLLKAIPDAPGIQRVTLLVHRSSAQPISR